MVEGEAVNDLFDTPVHKLYRKNAPQTSIDAAKSVDVSARERLVLDSIIESGERGITIKELGKKHPDVPYTTLSARPKALEEKSLIYYLGDTREGSRVIREKTKTSPKYTVCPNCKGVLMEFYNRECQECK